MTDASVGERLLNEARTVLSPFVARTRHQGDGVIVDLTRSDGTVALQHYADGPDELLAILAAEQRYLVEQEGHGSVRGATYLDKARERIRRASESANS